MASRMMSLWNGHIGLISLRLFTAFVIKKKKRKKNMKETAEKTPICRRKEKTIKKQCDASHLPFLISHMYENTPGDAMRCVFVVVFFPNNWLKYEDR